MAPRSRHSTSKKDTALAAPQPSHVIPDLTKLADMSSPAAAAPNGTAMETNGELAKIELGEVVNGGSGYERAEDLNEITRRQLEEDVKAYRYDLDFSTELLKDSNLSLSAQEVRTAQFRILDIGHQIRHCQHRIEQIDAQHALAASAVANGRPQFYFDTAPKRRASGMPATNNGTPGPAAKRPRISHIGTDAADETIDVELADGTSVQRLGYWMCHLCTANKYLSAGQSRVPSAPCKWPLRDVSKMLTHFLDMHTEHDPEERCTELGNALSANRGPFEYWLTRTKHMKVRDSDIMDECINTLQEGQVPEALRKINRAAGAFPNAMSVKDKAEDGSTN